MTPSAGSSVPGRRRPCERGRRETARPRHQRSTDRGALLEYPVTGVEQGLVRPDLPDGPGGGRAAHPVRGGQHARPGDDALGHVGVVALEALFPALEPLAQVDQFDPLGRGALDRPQGVQQARRVRAEAGAVGREPERQPGTEPHPEVRADRNVAGVQHRQQTAEMLVAGVEQVFHQLHDPRLAEPVQPAGALILSRFPRHQRAQVGEVMGVQHEPQGAHVPLDLPGLAADVGAELGRARFQRLVVGVVALCHVDDRRRRHRGLVPLERLLPGHQVVELQDGDPAGLQQFPGIPLRSGRVHQPLEVGQARADGHAPAQGAPLEREEPGDVRPVVQHGHPGTGPVPADGDREVRAEEGVGQRGGAVLKGPPGGDLGRAQLARVYYRDPHRDPQARFSAGLGAAADIKVLLTFNPSPQAREISAQASPPGQQRFGSVTKVIWMFYTGRRAMWASG